MVVLHRPDLFHRCRRLPQHRLVDCRRHGLRLNLAGQAGFYFGLHAGHFHRRLFLDLAGQRRFPLARLFFLPAASLLPETGLLLETGFLPLAGFLGPAQLFFLCLTARRPPLKLPLDVLQTAQVLLFVLLLLNLFRAQGHDTLLQLQRLVHIGADAKPQHDLVAEFYARFGLAGFKIQLCQLVRPLFFKLPLLVGFKDHNQALGRFAFRFGNFVTKHQAARILRRGRRKFFQVILGLVKASLFDRQFRKLA